jgi:peptidyl-prolyl cis-trans isomerase D
MGVISKIRERSGIAVGIIALGLALFVVGDDFLRFLSVGGSNDAVGEISGDKITLKDFSAVYNELSINFENNNRRQPNEQETQSLKDEAWRQISFEKIYLKEFGKLGIGLSKKEMEQMIKGDTLFVHPQIKSVPLFQDSITKKFSKAKVNQYLAAIQQNPMLRNQWVGFEQSLFKDRLQKKYENLFTNATYVTKAEARREYEAQNSKISTKFLYIPYTSIADSVVKPTDDQLKAYMQKYPKKYKAPESRSLEYVLFAVTPSKSDSTAFVEDLRDLAKKLAIAPNDSAFVVAFNRTTPPDMSFRSPQQIPDGIYSENKPLLKGGIYGPFLNGDKYTIVKVVDTKEDSTAFVRSAHILFKATTPEEKPDAKKRALEVLQKIKDGEDFAKMAKIYGSDGTKDKGGDLGWYGKGGMVAPFEVATLSRNETGLVNDLVETQFGYHIVKITQGSTKKKYKLAMIEKQIFATDESIQDASNKASEFQVAAKNYKAFLLKIKENPTLVKKVAEKISFTARSLEGISQASEIIKWSFNEGVVGETGKVFKIEEQGKTQFVVPVITSRTDKDELNVDFFRQQLDFEVRKEMKKEIITKKLVDSKGSLDDIAKKYGAGATVQNANEVTMQSTSLGAAGFSPVAVGKAFGLKRGQNTGILADESGILMVEVVEQTPAATISDYTQYKNTVLNNQKNTAKFFIFQALSELYNVEDYRGKVKGL